MTLTCFTHIVRLLSSFANGNIILAVEKRNAINDVSEFVNRVFDILNGASCQSLEHLIPGETLLCSVKQQSEELKSDWDCFQFNGKFNEKLNKLFE